MVTMVLTSKMNTGLLIKKAFAMRIEYQDVCRKFEKEQSNQNEIQTIHRLPVFGNYILF